MNSIRFALFLVMLGTGPLFAAQRQIDPDRSSITIHVTKTGLLSVAGHEHVVMAPIAEGSIVDGNPTSISFRVEAARLSVTPEEHQAEVQHSMEEEVLESSRFPEITFTSDSIQPAGDDAWNVSGNLRLHGQARRILVAVRNVEGRYVGATTIKQTDYGIQPIKALGGTIKVKNELKIEFAIYTK